MNCFASSNKSPGICSQNPTLVQHVPIYPTPLSARLPTLFFAGKRGTTASLSSTNTNTHPHQHTHLILLLLFRTNNNTYTGFIDSSIHCPARAGSPHRSRAIVLAGATGTAMLAVLLLLLDAPGRFLTL